MIAKVELIEESVTITNQRSKEVEKMFKPHDGIVEVIDVDCLPYLSFDEVEKIKKLKAYSMPKWGRIEMQPGKRYGRDKIHTTRDKVVVYEVEDV